jgi:hypothetical protein
MYTGDHVHIKICPVCADVLGDPLESCYICFHDESHGMLVKDEQLGVWVHQHCLDFFGVDNVLQYEQQHYDL